MSKNDEVRFFDYEVKILKEEFKGYEAPLKVDLTDIELEALSSIGKLKDHSHTYLGNKKLAT